MRGLVDRVMARWARAERRRMLCAWCKKREPASGSRFCSEACREYADEFRAIA